MYSFACSRIPIAIYTLLWGNDSIVISVGFRNLTHLLLHLTLAQLPGFHFLLLYFVVFLWSVIELFYRLRGVLF